MARRSRIPISYFMAAAVLFFLAVVNYESRNSLFTYAFAGLGLLAFFSVDYKLATDIFRSLIMSDKEQEE